MAVRGHVDPVTVGQLPLAGHSSPTAGGVIEIGITKNEAGAGLSV